MEKDLSVTDIKYFRTLTRRYLQMLRHEEPSENDSELKKEVWGLVKDILGDIALKDVDSAPSSSGWLSMLSWGGGSTKKEGPRWEETPGEVAYVVGWINSEDELANTSPPQSLLQVDSIPLDVLAASSDSFAAMTSEDKTSLDFRSSEASARSRRTKSSERSERETLPESPESYHVMAAKRLEFGINHISPYPTSAKEFLFIDIRMLKGSLTLRRGHYEGHTPLASIAFNGLRPVFRYFTSPDETDSPSTWALQSTLANLIVTDESLPTSKFKKIVQAPRPAADGRASTIKYERPPNKADFDASALWENPLLFTSVAQLDPKTGYKQRVEIRLDETLIFYHRRFLEEIVRFFKPPAKEETLTALFNAMMEATREYASETMDSLRTAEALMSRSVLEFAITEKMGTLIEAHLKAPLVIFPEEYDLPYLS